MLGPRIQLVPENTMFISIYFSNRYGKWHQDKTKEVSQRNVPRLIVFIMGGATFSEFRVGYEISNEKKNWEVIVGKFKNVIVFLIFEAISGIFKGREGGESDMSPEPTSQLLQLFFCSRWISNINT